MEGILILSSFSISKSDCVLTSVLSDSFLLKFPRAGVFFWLPLSRPRGWKKVHPMQSNAVPSLYNLMSAVLHLTPWVLHCGLIMTQWICGMIPCWCSDCAPIKMRFTSCVKCRSSVGHKNDDNDDDEHSCCVKCSSGPRAERGGFLQRETGVWTDMSCEPQVCRITMTRSGAASLIKHNSRLLGPQVSPELRVGKTGAPVCASPQQMAGRSWVGVSVFFVWISASTVFMSDCTRLSEEPISCSRLRRPRRAPRSRLLRLGGGTNSTVLPESAESFSHL